jgi:hypothetical protein
MSAKTITSCIASVLQEKKAAGLAAFLLTFCQNQKSFIELARGA